MFHNGDKRRLTGFIGSEIDKTMVDLNKTSKQPWTKPKIVIKGNSVFFFKINSDTKRHEPVKCHDGTRPINTFRGYLQPGHILFQTFFAHNIKMYSFSFHLYNTLTDSIRCSQSGIVYHYSLITWSSEKFPRTLVYLFFLQS